MQRISVFLRHRIARLAVLLVVLGGTLGLLAPAHIAQSAGCAYHPTLRTYYSDASHVTTIGQRGIDCTCNDVLWGDTSAYETIQVLCCSVNNC